MSNFDFHGFNRDSGRVAAPHWMARTFGFPDLGKTTVPQKYLSTVDLPISYGKLLRITDMLSTTDVNAIAKIPDLRSLYMFRDISRVSLFLRNNPFLINILVGAWFNIRERFTSNSPLVLEVVSDPEEPGCDQLFIFIQTRLPAELAIERLHQLDDEWWLDAMSDDDKMTIDIERL